LIGVEAVSAVETSLGASAITRLGIAPTASTAAGSSSFGELLAAGMRSVDSQVSQANALVRQFALDDSMPLHQVTFALEEARLAVELAMQIRTRLVESYRELMNMQL
jgi:flagellar hook-basal body complex protein FliE